MGLESKLLGRRWVEVVMREVLVIFILDASLKVS